MATARWFGVVFAVFQVSAFRAAEIPAYVRPIGYALAATLAVVNLGATWVRRRIRTVEGARRLALVTLLTDAALLSGYVWLYAFDTGSSLYLLFFILPAEAALKFQATGAIVTWAACATTYVLRELWASERYGSEVQVESITFRMGVLLIVALLVGMFARKLAQRSAELEAALSELEQQERWRQALIDMLAHDLRSPVGSATSALMVIRDRIDRLAVDDVRRLASVAVGQNERALRLTDDLLDLARSQQGRLEVHREEVSIGPLLHRVLTTLPVSASDVRIEIADDLRAWVDPARLEQVAANLITNAAKHGVPPVEVTVLAVDEVFELRVSDHGCGVPPELRTSLFTPFAEGTASGSVGLGLWIVQTLTEAHGGTVAYEDDGRHPSFVVRMPGAVRPPYRPDDAVVAV